MVPIMDSNGLVLSAEMRKYECNDQSLSGVDSFRLVCRAIVLLIIRVFCGWQLFQSGWSHLHNIPQMVQNFTDWGVPLPKLNVYISGITEMVGGLLWIGGFATRLISIPLFFNFCVAYWTASHDKVVQIFQNSDPFLKDDAFPFLIASVILFTFGPGIISIDGLLRHTIFRRKVPVAM